MTLRFRIIVSLALLKTALAANSNLPPSCGTTKRDFLAVLFRHGERAPLGTFPGDPNPQHPWPFGFGELTRDGRDRMNYLGMWLRHSLGEFMTSDTRDVGARSSPAPRCFDSAALLLDELYPASGKWAWHEGDHWQPVPITSMPKDHDKYTFYCPNFLRKMLADLLSKFATTKGPGNGLLQTLSANAKINVSEPRKLLDALDALVVQSENNLKMPDWFEEGKEQFLQFNHAVYVAVGSALSRNMGGEIIRDIADKVKEYYYQQNVTEEAAGGIMAPLDVPYKTLKRLHLFSYHDLNVIAVLYSLNPNEIKKRPDYGSLVIFESVKNTLLDEPQIRVLYRDGETDHVVYDIKGCPYPCTAKEFLAYVDENFKPMTNSECGIPDDYILL
ncbi:testicular acid phosphatase homolog [Ornithodoros turicata]|uniref:testicular acid phosphatase homolog n=1 Tax=Ornithodoros turicata TaxID=34597 RepID=UPI003138C01C